jgi:hypothetical protein
MDTREKANDLVNRYYYMLPNNGSLSGGINSCDSRYKEAIECAFVTVDEILESNPNYEYWRTYDDEAPSAITFWQEVKQWIQKIKDKEPGAQWTIEDMKRGKTIWCEYSDIPSPNAYIKQQEQ